MELQSEVGSGGKAAMKPIKTRGGREERATDEEEEEEEEEEGEPLSPLSRVFLEPDFNCHIICIMGSGKTIDVDVVKAGLAKTLLRHPRFSSRQACDGRGGGRWVRVEVDLDRHVICPEVEPTGIPSADLYVSDYLSRLSTTPLDRTRPPWDLHLLNLPTSTSPATAALRLHHSLGDGSSLVSLLLACTRKASDPSSLPAFPQMPAPAPRRLGIRELLAFVVVLWNTVVDVVSMLATAVWLRDTETPLKGTEGVELRAKRFVHRAVAMQDVRAVRRAAGGTVNEVLLGMISAGVARYLMRRSGCDTKGKRGGEDIRLRSTSLVNVRKSPAIHDLHDMMEGSKKKTEWGNCFGYVILPIPTAHHDNPLDYIKAAKAISKRKKSSLEAPFSFSSGKLMLRLFGTKFAKSVCHRVLSNTTISLSNVVGPIEEISFYGHPLTYMAPSVYGHPQALTVHYMSYMGKIEIVLAVDESAIHDPDQLCDDFVESLNLIKDAAVKEQ